MTETLRAELRDAIASSQVVFVIGGGTTIAALGNDTEASDRASWRGLLRHGARFCHSIQLADTAWLARVESLVNAPDLEMLLGAGDLICSRLRAPHGGDFAAWLRASVGSLVARDRALLSALAALQTPLITTNYDDLLERELGVPTVTWRDEASVELALDGREPAIVHVHGSWRRPESIVLGNVTYQQLTTNPHTVAIMRSLFVQRVVCFVGFGDSLSDPHFGALMQWCEQSLHASPHRHFALRRLEGTPRPRSELDVVRRLFPLDYGESHSDLPEFLRTLKPRKRTQTRLRVATVPELLRQGMRIANIVERTMAIDYETLEGLRPEHEGEPRQWVGIVRDHPNTVRLLLAGEDIVGYWHIIPLFEDVFARMKAGAMGTTEIASDQMCAVELPGTYDAYFMILTIAQEWRDTATVRMLFESVLDALEEFAESGVFFRELCLDAYTPMGKAIARSFEMELVAHHDDRGDIYLRRMFPFPRHAILARRMRLTSLYQAHFLQPDA